MRQITLRDEFKTEYRKYDVALPKECGNCGATENLQIHHIVPLASGGTNRITNLVRLCCDCHANTHGNSPLIKLRDIGVERNVEQGRRRPGRVPFGYKQGVGETYEVDKQQAEVVRLIFRLRYLGEYSTLNIATILNHLAIPSPASKKWSHTQLAAILENPIYFGEAVYNGKVFGKKYEAVLPAEYAVVIERFNVKYEGRRLKPRKLCFDE